MIIKPKVRGFICTTAHPAGCAKNVQNQINYVKNSAPIPSMKNALIIGCSAGYGLASRISAAFSGGANTLGIMFERPSQNGKPATAGWYNTAAFEDAAKSENLYAKTINGDAFSADVKQQAINTIRRDMGKIDLVVYSLAAPRRAMADGSVVSSVLKTTGDAYTNKTIDLASRTVSDITIPPATEEEIANTVTVMGGQDWQDWIAALSEADLLAEDAVTVAYSYIGPSLTHPMYKNGSIGAAKQHLFETANTISDQYIRAYIAVNKALVTQSSAAIPIVPLYISILYKVMKEMDLHEGCIQQIQRLLRDKLFSGDTDQTGQIRMDDLEMRKDVQDKVSKIWAEITTENTDSLADIDGYWQDFYQMFGFDMDGIDYNADVDPAVSID